jgi:hypothetical protein
MGPVRWFNAIVAKRATDWFVAPLVTGDRIAPEAAYLNIHLRSLHIRDIRRGPVRFSPAVHSFIEFHHRDTGTAAVHTFTVPEGLRAIDPKNVDRVVVSSQRLLGPVPYRGGDVSVDIALFSIETGNVLDGIMDIIEELATAAGVGYVDAALPFVKPIDSAVRLLVGASKGDVLEIGLSKDFDELSAGLFVVARAPAANLAGVELIHDAQHRVSRADGGAFDYPYFTFEIVAKQRREAWTELPALREAHAALNAVARTGNVRAAKQQFGAFRWTMLSSPDLLDADAQAIVKTVEADLERKLGGTAVAADASIELTPLEELDLF